MFSCSLFPMDRGSITHLMCPLNLSPVGDTSAAPAPGLQSSGVLGTLSDGLARVEGIIGREKHGKKKNPTPCITKSSHPVQQSSAHQHQGWVAASEHEVTGGCRAGEGGAHQPPRLPQCLGNATKPSSCLVFPFLAKITPEHVSMLSCKESHFGEPFSLSFCLR